MTTDKRINLIKAFRTLVYNNFDNATSYSRMLEVVPELLTQVDRKNPIRSIKKAAKV